MSEDTFLALLQINVAIGCLYCGLPVARYRNKLFDVIVDAINSCGHPYVAIADQLRDVFQNDGELSSKHHYIRQWAHELPEPHREKIDGYESWDISGEYSQSLPLMYRLYYRKSLDKTLTWLLTVVVSIALSWATPFGVHGSLPFILLVIIGQTIPLINVALGHRMIGRIGKDFRLKIDDVVSVYRSRQVSSAAKDVITTLEGHQR